MDEKRNDVRYQNHDFWQRSLSSASWHMKLGVVVVATASAAAVFRPAADAVEDANAVVEAVVAV